MNGSSWAAPTQIPVRMQAVKLAVALYARLKMASSGSNSSNAKQIAESPKVATTGQDCADKPLNKSVVVRPVATDEIKSPDRINGRR